MLLDDIADLISSGGIGTVGSTSAYGIYKGLLPDAPNAAVAVYETGGLEPYRKMHSTAGAVVAERPRIQVVVRSTAYSTGRQKANDAWKLLEGLPERTVNGTRYLYAAAVQAPFPIGRDANDRILIACNFDVVKALSTA